MASIPFYLKTNGKWQVGSSPMAVGGSLRVVQEGKNLTFYGSGNNVPIIEKTHVTDISKNVAGDTYATVEEFEEATKDFFHKASAGGGGDTDVYVKRDIANPELHDITRYKDGLHVVWDRWNGTEWEQIGLFGNSMRTDRFITFASANRLTGFYHKTPEGVEERVLGPALTKENTTVVGMGQNTLVFAATDMLNLKFEETTKDENIQALYHATLTTNLLEFKSVQKVQAKVTRLSVLVDTADEEVAFRVVYYNSFLRRNSDIIWESGTEASYMSENPETTIKSDGASPIWINLTRPYISDIDNVVHVSVFTKTPITYKGYIFPDNGENGEDEFILWMRGRRRYYTKREMITKPDVTKLIDQTAIGVNQEVLKKGEVTSFIKLPADAKKDDIYKVTGRIFPYVGQPPGYYQAKVDNPRRNLKDEGWMLKENAALPAYTPELSDAMYQQYTNEAIREVVTGVSAAKAMDVTTFSQQVSIPSKEGDSILLQKRTYEETPEVLPLTNSATFADSYLLPAKHLTGSNAVQTYMGLKLQSRAIGGYSGFPIVFSGNNFCITFQPQFNDIKFYVRERASEAFKSLSFAITEQEREYMYTSNINLSFYFGDPEDISIKLGVKIGNNPWRYETKYGRFTKQTGEYRLAVDSLDRIITSTKEGEVLVDTYGDATIKELGYIIRRNNRWEQVTSLAPIRLLAEFRTLIQGATYYTGGDNSLEFTHVHLSEVDRVRIMKIGAAPFFTYVYQESNPTNPIGLDVEGDDVEFWYTPESGWKYINYATGGVSLFDNYENTSNTRAFATLALLEEDYAKIKGDNSVGFKVKTYTNLASNSTAYSEAVSVATLRDYLPKELAPTSETLTGFTWKGKPIYRKHFSGSSASWSVGLLSKVADELVAHFGSGNSYNSTKGDMVHCGAGYDDHLNGMWGLRKYANGNVVIIRLDCSSVKVGDVNIGGSLVINQNINRHYDLTLEYTKL